MNRRPRIDAVVAVVAYLAAAFVPCDPPFVFLASGTEAGGSAHAHADDSSGPSEREQAAVAPARDDSHASGAAHSHAHSSHGPSRAEPHAHGHGPAEARSAANDSSNPTKQARAGLPESPISFKAQCLCGCDDVRGTVGGGASRLGSAIPADAVFALAARSVIVVPEAPPIRLAEGHPPSDAIPI